MSSLKRNVLTDHFIYDTRGIQELHIMISEKDIGSNIINFNDLSVKDMVPK